MNCHDYQDLILDLARNQADIEQVPGARAHLEACPLCASRLQQQRALTAELRALAATTADAKPTDTLERRLLESFIKQHSGRSGATLAAGRARRWMPMAAAVAIAIGAITWWYVSGSRPTGHLTETAPSAPTAGVLPAAAPTEIARDITKNPAAEVAPNNSQAQTRTVPASRALRILQPAGFAPLPGTATLPSFESGEIVRMEIPLASLPAYGIEIPADAGNRPVQADLLVGQDGKARAIRLVAATSQESRSRQ